MKKWLVLFVMLITVVACTEAQSGTVKLNELINFSTIKLDSEKIFTDDQVAIFKSAVDNAVKIDGIVDVSDPMYQFNLAGKDYFLWLTNGGGSIMHANNTHIIYHLTEKDAQQLQTIVND